MAEAGNASAQYLLAWRYRTGIGADKNREKEEYWLHRAAEQGHTDAQIALAVRYLDDLPGWQPVNGTSAPGLETLGTKGDAAMQYRVGMTYLEHGNRVDARRWLRRAADRGESAAEAVLKALDARQRGKRPPAANP